MTLFYTKNILASKLSIDESQHALKSLRKQINDSIFITEGKGYIYSAKISNIKNNLITYSEVEIFEKNEKTTKIHIAIAPTKSRIRFEWFLEKVTEIGVDSIYPLICQNSERKIINHIRCEKILISAMKQSKNSILPKLNNPIQFESFSHSCPKNAYIAHCYKTHKKCLKDILLKNNHKKNITLFIGPEGDFSKKEVNFAKSKGIIPVTLGTTRLRTETAGIIGCSIINTLVK